jgi:NADPH-dependent 7-cyano-7-deazaguanine reductase QueF
MMFQIEYLTNECSKNINEKITNLINHECIEGWFLFNRRVM